MESWPYLHGAITHFPVAMLIAGILFDIGGAAFKKRDLRMVGFWMLVVAVLGAGASLISGTLAANALFDGRVPAILARHRLMAYITGVLALILVLWRIKARDAMRGPVLYASLILGFLLSVSAGVTGYIGGSIALGGLSQQNARASSNRRQSITTLHPAGATAAPAAAPTPALIQAGKTAFESDNLGCTSCHSFQGVGGTIGPDLTHEGSKHPNMNWQVAHLNNPDILNPYSIMPSFNTVSTQTKKALAAFLVSQK